MFDSVISLWLAFSPPFLPFWDRWNLNLLRTQPCCIYKSEWGKNVVIYGHLNKAFHCQEDHMMGKSSILWQTPVASELVSNPWLPTLLVFTLQVHAGTQYTIYTLLNFWFLIGSRGFPPSSLWLLSRYAVFCLAFASWEGRWKEKVVFSLCRNLYSVLWIKTLK